MAAEGWTKGGVMRDDDACIRMESRMGIPAMLSCSLIAWF
jgi:hypothetical protein